MRRMSLAGARVWRMCRRFSSSNSDFQTDEAPGSTISRRRCNILRCIVCFLAAVAALQAPAQATAVFNWSNPAGLTPAYAAPTAENRYGEYIGGVEFTSAGVTLVIDDEDVAQLSQKARFLYGYLTQVVEMRAYPGSLISITAPEGRHVARIEFAGAKADESYMQTPEGKLLNGVWTPAETRPNPVIFTIDATINCTKITVVTEQTQGVDDIVADTDAEAQWYTVGGVELPARPAVPGLYVRRLAGRSKLVIIK